MKINKKSRFIEENREQQSFLCTCPGTLDNHISEDNIVLVFEQVISKLDLSEIIEQYSDLGGKAYHPRILTKVLIYGYYMGIQSSRKLEWATVDSISMKYLTGGHEIDFKTIATFRSRFSSVFPRIFSQITQIIYNATGIQVKLIYMDGVKLKANASDKKHKLKSEWQEKLVVLEEDIIAYFDQSAEIDKKENLLFGEKDNGYSLEKDSKNKIIDKVNDEINKINKEKREKKKQEQIKRTKELMTNTKNLEDENVDEKNSDVLEIKVTKEEKNDDVDIEKKLKYYSKIHNLLHLNMDAKDSTKLNLTDPESRFVKMNGRVRFGYNCQFTTKNQIPLSAIATNKETDHGQFIPNIERARKNLPDAIIEGGVADAGYPSGTTLEEINKFNIDAYIAMGRSDSENNTKNYLDEENFEVWNFQYNEEDDSFTCRGGHLLNFHAGDIFKKDVQYTAYHCKPSNCTQCEFKALCLTTKKDKKLGYKKIQIDKYHFYRNDMVHKMRSNEAQDIYKLRQIEPEPVFGNLKHNKGMRGFVLRGLVKVNAELQIMSMGLGIGKLAKYLKEPGNRKEFNNI